MRARVLVLTVLSTVICALVGDEFLGRAHSGGVSESPDAKAPAPPPLVLSAPLATHIEVRTPFRVPNTPYGPGHRGVDLLGHEGQPVRAAAAGTVLHAGVVVDRPVVSVEHDSGLRTTYEPVRPRISEGQPVRRGQLLGVLVPGHPDCASTPPHACLHWGLRNDEKYLDPLDRLGSPAGGTRLLPW